MRDGRQFTGVTIGGKTGETENTPPRGYPNFITLEGRKRVARGSECAVFRHPERDDVLVKVRDFRRMDEHRGPVNAFWLRRSEGYRLRWLRRQFDGYLQLHHREEPPEAPFPLAHIHGFAMTDLGPAFLMEKIARPNGDLAPTYRRLQKQGNLGAAQIEALNGFVRSALAWNLPMTDLNPTNIVFGHRGGTAECVMIDGFGDYSTLHLRSLFPRINRPIALRKFRMLAGMLDLTWDAKALAFRA